MTSGAAVLFSHQGCPVSMRMAELLLQHVEESQPVSLIAREQLTMKALTQRGWMKLSQDLRKTELTERGRAVALRAMAALADYEAVTA